MVSSSASKIVHTASEDRISDLPKNVIDMILEALPLGDAVRISLLSRKWQYLSVTISKLVFDDQFYKCKGIKYSEDLQVKDIINKILLLHVGPIHKFTLHLNPAFSSLKDNINSWLHFLSRNGIKELTLHFPCRLGSQLFRCHELTHISFTNCHLNPLAVSEGFPNLTTLELNNLYVHGKFGDIISACLLLETVSIESCYGICNLVVSSPNLKYLHVNRAHDLKKICLSSSKNVATLSISMCDDTRGRKMEKLSLGGNIFDLSGASSMPKTLPTSLENLKKIVISYVEFNDAAQILCALCMIQSSPILSELEIWGQCAQSTTGVDHGFVEDFGDHSYNFDKLKSVKLMFLRNLKPEIALIKLLIARSPLLEQMSIHVATNNDQAFSMCKKLMQFGRASTKDALIFLDR